MPLKKQKNQLPEGLQQHFLNLFRLAMVDTELHPMELKLLYDLGVEKGVAKETIDQLIAQPTELILETPISESEKAEYLYDFVRMILADGVVDSRERLLFAELAVQFGCPLDKTAQFHEVLLAHAQQNLEFRSLRDKISGFIQNNSVQL